MPAHLLGATSEQTDTAIQVKALLSAPSSAAELLLSTEPSDWSAPIVVGPVSTTMLPSTGSAVSHIATFDQAGLAPDTRYYWRLRDGGVIDDSRTGETQTDPPPDAPASFSLIAGNCAGGPGVLGGVGYGNDNPVWAVIADKRPRRLLHQGDFFYLDYVDVQPIEVYREYYHGTITAPVQGDCYLVCPITASLDDHDIGPNDSYGWNSDRTEPTEYRARALQTHREYLPAVNRALSAPDGALYRSRVLGRVRLVITASREDRNHKSMAAGPNKRMWDAAQDDWFLGEIEAARDACQIVLWVTQVPWQGPAGADADHWSGYASHRFELAQHVLARGMARSVYMITGSAHRIHMDDGTNNVAGGWPTVCPGAFGRRTSGDGIAEGPYSHGTFFLPNEGGQFVEFAFDDAGGDAITVTAVAHRQSAILATMQSEIEVPGAVAPPDAIHRMLIPEGRVVGARLRTPTGDHRIRKIILSGEHAVPAAVFYDPTG